MRPALCAVFAALLTVIACGNTESGPPEPVVSVQELEARLDEHLSRVVAGALGPEAIAGPVVRSRPVGCAALPGGGPSWGIVPRAELTVTAGVWAGEYALDVGRWLGRNGFSAVAADPEVQRSGDGVDMRVDELLGRTQFTIAVSGPCAWPPDREGGPPTTGRLAPLPAPAGPGQAMDPRYGQDDGRECTRPEQYVYNLDAPPFAGPGPHPMHLEAPTDQISLPEEWGPPDAPGLLDGDHAAVQLVVCVRVLEEGADTGEDVTCSYSSAPDRGGSPVTFDLFDSTYQVTVRQARDGIVVDEFTIPGSESGVRACPFRISASGPLRLPRGIDEAALHERLRPLFEQAR